VVGGVFIVTKRGMSKRMLKFLTQVETGSSVDFGKYSHQWYILKEIIPIGVILIPLPLPIISNRRILVLKYDLSF